MLFPLWTKIIPDCRSYKLLSHSTMKATSSGMLTEVPNFHVFRTAGHLEQITVCKSRSPSSVESACMTCRWAENHKWTKLYSLLFIKMVRFANCEPPNEIYSRCSGLKREIPKPVTFGRKQQDGMAFLELVEDKGHPIYSTIDSIFPRFLSSSSHPVFAWFLFIMVHPSAPHW